MIFKVDFCAQTQYLYIVNTFYMSQLNPKNFSDQLDHTFLFTPFNEYIGSMTGSPIKILVGLQ